MDNKLIRQITDAVRQAAAPRTSPYDSAGTVTRVEGGTAWVHLPGGVQETPVKMTINASPGDSVRVRVSGGRAWITGNDTAPPTDDSAAKRVQANLQEATDAIYRAIQAISILTRRLKVQDADGNVLADFDADQHLAQIAGWQATDGHLKAEAESSGVDLDANSGKVKAYGIGLLGRQVGSVELSQSRLSYGVYTSGVQTSTAEVYLDDDATTFRMDSGQNVSDLRVGETQLGTESYSSAYGDNQPSVRPTIRGALGALGDRVTTLEALPTSVSDSPDVTQNVPNATNATVSFVALNKGWYLIQGVASFAANGTGHRNIHFSLTPDSAAQNRYASSAAPGSAEGRTILQVLWIRHITADSTPVYLNAYQTSGAALAVTNIGITALKISND